MSNEVAAAPPKNEIAIIADNINKGLIAFEKRKSELTILKEEVEGLNIESLEDKAGIRQVTEARKKLKSARVEIEKEGKAMRDPLTAISKRISAKENELVGIIEPTEKALKTKEDWVKAEEKRIEQEAEEKERQRIQARIDSLAAYGYQIDYNMLVSLNDEDFARIVENARIEHEKDIALKTEQAEAERLKAEQQEKDRLELLELRRKQEEAEKAIREREEEVARKEAVIKAEEDRRLKEEEKSAKARYEKRISDRIDQLFNLGLRFDGTDDYYKGYGCFVPVLDIQCHSEEAWGDLVSEVTIVVSKGKLAETAKQEEEKKQEKIRQEAELERIRKEAAERALAEEKVRKEEADRQEVERIAAASDKDKFAVILSHLEALPAPVMKSAKAKKLLSEVQTLRDKIIEHIKVKA